MADLKRKAIDPRKRSEGVRADYDDTTWAVLRPLNSDEYRVAHSRLAHRLRDVPDDQEQIVRDQVFLEAVVDGCIVELHVGNWGEQPLEFTRENALMVLRDAPEFQTWVLKQIADTTAYYYDAGEADAKNSPTTSAAPSGGGRTRKAA